MLRSVHTRVCGPLPIAAAQVADPPLTDNDSAASAASA
jgi:hypothetical protein